LVFLPCFMLHDDIVGISLSCGLNFLTTKTGKVIKQVCSLYCTAVVLDVQLEYS